MTNGLAELYVNEAAFIWMQSPDVARRRMPLNHNYRRQVVVSLEEGPFGDLHFRMCLWVNVTSVVYLPKRIDFVVHEVFAVAVIVQHSVYQDWTASSTLWIQDVLAKCFDDSSIMKAIMRKELPNQKP
mmetsp:Transcript_13258/g.28130  ORF Transcript_13258/g.28130 Transcript_13258/m.28130 type:complete len:128 (-) Transcript_13258:251-634(-)